MTNTRHNSFSKKALSVVLTLVMALSYVGLLSGVIGKDIFGTAQKAYAATASDYNSLKTAITNANNASGTTTIQITADISTGEVGKFPTISKNVILDLNGHNITFSYSGDTPGEGDSTEYQLPSELQGTQRDGPDYLDTAMFSVSTSGSLQIVNKSSTDAKVFCYTKGSKPADAQTGNNRYITTSSNLIYSTGTLILGDKTNSSYNNFTLDTQSVARTETKSTDYSHVHARANAFTVTINNANAKFFMYGGTVSASATSRGKRDGKLSARCYPINIINAYTAEIYGGTVNIPYREETGLRNSDDTDSDGSAGIFSCIRTKTENTYIFDVSSYVETEAGGDTGDAYIDQANIDSSGCTAGGPLFYGGDLTSYGRRAKTDSAAVYVYNIRGDYRLAINGTINPTSAYATNANRVALSKNSNTTQNLHGYTLFYFGDTVTENGVYPWSYDTFHDYLSAHTSSNDAYFTYSASHLGDSNNYAGDTNYLYHRNGYRQNGWKGATTPGGTPSTSYTSTNSVGFNASNGGSLFLYPVWSLVTYNITYDLNAGSQQGTPALPNGYPQNYNITSSSKLPLPTRSGYRFMGWKLTQRNYNKIGGGTTTTMSESYDSVDPWTVNTIYNPKWNASSSTYSDGQSLNGKNGHIWLQAQWSEIPYTATFDWDNKVPTDPATKTTTTADYNINSTFSFPSGCTKDYYTFNNIWAVSTTAGNWASTNTGAAGATTSVGKYGDVTFTAQYTPIQYTITFDPNGGSNVPSNYSNTVDNKYHYTYESTDTLPIPGRLGYTFGGWKPETTVTEAWDATIAVWDQNDSYASGTSVNHKHGDVTLVAQWTTVSSNVHYVLGTGESLAGSNLTPTYNYNSTLALDTAKKTGYDFDGWKIIVPSGTGNTYYDNYYTQYQTENGVTVGSTHRWGVTSNRVDFAVGDVLPSEKIGDVWLAPVFSPITYHVTYKTNDGTACTSFDYTIEDSITLASTTKNGWSFNGWAVSLTDPSDDVYNWIDSPYAANANLSNMYGNVTLTAQWIATPYEITYATAGGTLPTNTANPQGYTIEASSTLPQPTKTGYTFTGWQATSWGTDSIWANDNTAETEFTDTLPYGNYGNVTLTAQWTPTAYTISKTTNGGSNSGSVTYHINDAAFTLGASVLAGYNFVNWTVDADAGNWVKDTPYGANTSISGKWGNVNLTAHFTPITYTITYKDKDGETQYADTYTIEDAVTIRDYAVPGYTFGGWIVSGFDETTGGGWHNGDDISAGTLSANMYYGNITLTPILTAKSYTVTYDFNGAPATCGNLPYTIESTDELPGNTSANPPTKTGHDFTGWKVVEVGDEGNWTLNAVVPGNTALTGKYGSVTLQAQWTPKKYTITYITGTYPDGTTRQGTYGQTAPDLTDAEKAKPADPQYTYTFDHWDPALTTVTGEKTYTAVYTNTLNKYDITWMIPDDVNGTLTNYTATVTPNVEYGTAPVYNNGVNPELASDNPSEYEWRFAGWSLTEGGAKLESIPAVSGTATYYALFTKVLAPEQVIWDIEGVTNTELWGIGEIPEWRHDTPTKADANGYKYTFTHWDPTPVTVVQHGGPYTYTAKFSSSLQDYTVTLKLNGGTMSDPLTMGYQMGDTLTFPEPEKTGYTFAGWLLDEAVGTWAAGTTVPAGSYATGTKWGNASFTAQWTPVEYTVTFAAASEDDVLPANMTYTIESTDALPAATREGHTQTGWLISMGGGNWTQGATLAAAYSLLENYGNVTLTPIWQVNTYTLTWISGDYTETSEAEYGSAILAYAPLSRQGYSASWDNEVPATMPAQNLTFTAVYTATEYYVRLYVNGGSAVDNFYYTIESNSTLPTPTRDGATFTGWKVTQAQGNWVRNAIVAGGASLNGKFGNVTLTAQWELETHTVTWVAGDVTKEAVWLYGAVPSYDGTPYKSPDETNSYVFRGWDKEIVPVTEDVTYTALFDATERTYTVIWNIDGATTTQYYHYGDTPTYPGETDPARPSTYEYDFTFSGWSPAVADVTKDVTYTAQFDVFTKLQGLSIDVSSLFLNIGANETVTAQIYPATATVRDVVWTSKNTGVATIDSAGTVTAVSPGVALINVSSVDKSFNAYCVVTVAPTHTSYVAISAGGVSTTQLPGSLLQLTATLQPENATDTGITWSSGDIAVATVDNTGLVKFVGVGETDITAMASDGFSLGSIHVVTTTDESEVEDSVTTYRVTFGDFATGFRFKDDGEVYRSGYCSVPEGETLRFKLNVEDDRQGAYSVFVNGSRISYGDDYWYALEDVHANMVVTLRDGGAGSGISVPEDDQGGSNSGMTFFQRIAAFFRKLVEFFRGIFNK